MTENALNVGAPPPEPREPEGPVGHVRGHVQRDGNVTSQFAPPQRNARPATKPAVVARDGDSGIERSMGELADRLHPYKR